MNEEYTIEELRKLIGFDDDYIARIEEAFKNVSEQLNKEIK